MKGYWGFCFGNGEIVWVKKEDVKDVRLMELVACLNAQM